VNRKAEGRTEGGRHFLFFISITKAVSIWTFSLEIIAAPNDKWKIMENDKNGNKQLENKRK
jgi:hypothetical protein